MAAVSLSHTFEYPYESFFRKLDSKTSELSLAAAKSTLAFPYFFKGKLLKPERTSAQLLAVAKIAGSRFYIPPAMVAKMILASDPVITSGANKLRFESFSQCCGVYCRLDLLQNAVDSEFKGRGTTNVDFNLPMRDALTKLRRGSDVNLMVGSEAFELESFDGKVIEKKVDLPLRWYKGFIEVQSYSPSLKLAHECKGPVAQRFLSSLPSTVSAKGVCYLIPGVGSIRQSQRPARNSIMVGGVERLRILAPLAREIEKMRIYSSENGVSAFELIFPESRMILTLSPEACRGFSGEGQALQMLVDDLDTELVDDVLYELKSKAQLSESLLLESVEGDADHVKSALSWLGSNGIVGFDLFEDQWFHREFPYEPEVADRIHPRYKSANKIVSDKAFEIIKEEDRRILEAYVKGSGVQHRVRLVDGSYRCTCPWYSKHQGERGVCKHILALEILKS